MREGHKGEVLSAIAVKRIMLGQAVCDGENRNKHACSQENCVGRLATCDVNRILENISCFTL